MRIAAGLMIKGLGVPFSGEASVRDIKVNPDVKTRVDNVGVDFGIQVRSRPPRPIRVLFHEGKCQHPSEILGNTRTRELLARFPQPGIFWSRWCRYWCSVGWTADRGTL